MKHHLYIILLLAFCSCDRKANNKADAVQQADSLQTDSFKTKVEVYPSIPFFDNYLFSHNATSPNIYGDTIYSREIDIFLKNHPGDGTTLSDMRSYYRATEKLDTLIGEVFKKVYQKLKSEPDKKMFKASQDNWKRYFARETAFLHEIYYTNELKYGFGREHAITQAQWAFQVARQRLILLKNIDEQTYADESMK